MARWLVGESPGQMTVEFAVVLPVMLLVGFIALHSLSFVGQCAAFDAVFRHEVALSAQEGIPSGDGSSAVTQRICQVLPFAEGGVSVSAEMQVDGHLRYVGELTYLPRIAQGVSIMGVSVPPLRHRVSFLVSPYRSGVVI